MGRLDWLVTAPLFGRNPTHDVVGRFRLDLADGGLKTA